MAESRTGATARERIQEGRNRAGGCRGGLEATEPSGQWVILHRMDPYDIRDPKLENFSELVGNGKHFRVPLYQRVYSWPEELWEDLWQDLGRLAATERGRHFMGVVVLEERGDRDFVIVDGQQRLVTLTILAIAAIRRLMEMGGGRRSGALGVASSILRQHEGRRLVARTREALAQPD